MHAAQPDVSGMSLRRATCTTVPYKQIIIAMGEGSKASLSAFDRF
jgi:alkyl hydroperoxide reductase subunit AhpF